MTLLKKFMIRVRRDGLIVSLKKAWAIFYQKTLAKISLKNYLIYKKNIKQWQKDIDAILKKPDYGRVIIFRGSAGWNIPLFQRPQQLALKLADQGLLVLFEVTKKTDDVDLYHKINDNLLLINYQNKHFIRFLKKKIHSLNCSKYVLLTSTSWDINKALFNKYLNSNFTIIYDYLDDLNPQISGAAQLHKNIVDLHQGVIENSEKLIILCTADNLFEDIKRKTGSEQNIFYVSNGVDYQHFTTLDKKVSFSKEYQKIVDSKKPIIGYYGALAKWFDYELLIDTAKKCSEYQFVLFGVDYDGSYNQYKHIFPSNLHYLGKVDYKHLPYYASKFKVSILPFKINELTEATNPIKIFEYMALAHPIVSTNLKECRKYKSVTIANNSQEFIKNIKTAVEKKPDVKYLEVLKKEALENTWSQKATDIKKAMISFEKNMEINDVK